jgi:hypothetical protein
MPADVFTNDGLKVRTSEDYPDIKERLSKALRLKEFILVLDADTEKECTLVTSKVSAIVNVPTGMSKQRMN